MCLAYTVLHQDLYILSALRAHRMHLLENCGLDQSMIWTLDVSWVLHNVYKCILFYAHYRDSTLCGNIAQQPIQSCDIRCTILLEICVLSNLCHSCMLCTIPYTPTKCLPALIVVRVHGTHDALILSDTARTHVHTVVRVCRVHMNPGTPMYVQGVHNTVAHHDRHFDNLSLPLSCVVTNCRLLKGLRNKFILAMG